QAVSVWRLGGTHETGAASMGAGLPRSQRAREPLAEIPPPAARCARRGDGAYRDPPAGSGSLRPAGDRALAQPRRAGALPLAGWRPSPARACRGAARRRRPPPAVRPRRGRGRLARPRRGGGGDRGARAAGGTGPAVARSRPRPRAVPPPLPERPAAPDRRLARYGATAPRHLPLRGSR